MAAVSAYLNFNGNAEEAFNFYKSVFGGEFNEIQKFSEVPGMDNLGDDDKNKIMHVSYSIGQSVVMGSDTLESMGHKHVAGNNFSLAVTPDSEAETERIFSALSEGGKVTQPLEKAFWGAYFGMLTDKFGINWMVNYQLS